MGEQLRLFDVEEAEEVTSPTQMAIGFLKDLSTAYEQAYDPSPDDPLGFAKEIVIAAIAETAGVLERESLLVDLMAALLRVMLREGRVLEDEIIDVLAKWQEYRRG